MKVKDILQCNWSSVAGKRTIQKALRKVKPFAKYPIDEEIEFDKLEKAILIYCKKYNMNLSFYFLGERFHGYIESFKSHKTIVAVYGYSMYELYCKLVIAMYDIVLREAY